MISFKIHVHYDKNINTVRILLDKKSAGTLVGLLHETSPMTQRFKDVRNKLIELIEKEME